MISAVILAGASAQEFDSNLKSRAMVKIGGVTMLDRVASAIIDIAEEVFIVGDVETKYSATILKPAKTLMENIDIALKKTKGDYILIATSDIPFITKDCVKNFVEKAVKLNAGFVYPICSKAKCGEKYPKLKRTYVKIKDGEFTGGNLMLMKKDFLMSVMPIMQDLYLYRKSPLKLAKMIGFDVIWKLILSKFNPNALNIEYLENKISALFNDKVKALIAEDPAICEDLDSPDELVLFEELIKR